MRKRKTERKNQFIEVNGEIQSIKNEIYGGDYALKDAAVNETDLSLRKLEDLHGELQALQSEKVNFVELSYILHDFLMVL